MCICNPHSEQMYIPPVKWIFSEWSVPKLTNFKEEANVFKQIGFINVEKCLL